MKNIPYVLVIAIILFCLTPPTEAQIKFGGGSAAIVRGISLTVGDPGAAAAVTQNQLGDYVTIPFACTLAAYNLIIDTADATVTVEFLHAATGTAKPSTTLNTSGIGVPSGTAVHSATMTDFSQSTGTAITKDDMLAIRVKSTGNTAKFVNATLQCDQ